MANNNNAPPVKKIKSIRIYNPLEGSLGFWYFSLLGGATLFAYAIYKEDPVFIVGQGAGLFIYSRNLYLIRKRSLKEQS